MKSIVITLGVVSGKVPRDIIDRFMVGLGVYDYELIDYGPRVADAENEKRTFTLENGRRKRMEKIALRIRLTQLLKTRLRYEPPRDLSEVVAVLYGPSDSDDSPYWDEVAREFHVPVYRVIAD